MSNSTLFRDIISRAESQQRSEIEWRLGGNAPVMSIRFFKEGADVLLAAQMSTKLQNSLPAGLRLVGESVEMDDVHFILEYKAGEKWGPLKSPRANR